MNARYVVRRCAVIQNSRWRRDRRKLGQFDAMAVDGANPPVADFKSVHTCDGGTDDGFVEACPVIALEANCDDQFFEARPAFIVQVQFEVCRVMAQCKCQCADELASVEFGIHGVSFRVAIERAKGSSRWARLDQYRERVAQGRSWLPCVFRRRTTPG